MNIWTRVIKIGSTSNDLSITCPVGVAVAKQYVRQAIELQRIILIELHVFAKQLWWSEGNLSRHLVPISLKVLRL